MGDDRVDMVYVIHRLEDIVSGTNQKDETVLRQVEELKRELIYNLGVNQLRRKDRGSDERGVHAAARDACHGSVFRVPRYGDR